MNIYEVPAIIEDELPAIKNEIHKSCAVGNVHAVIQVLTSYTKKMMNLHNVPVVINCLSLADSLYNKGNNLVKNAIENVFVFSFSAMRTCCDAAEWKLIQAKIPLALYSVYVNQVSLSGI